MDSIEQKLKLEKRIKFWILFFIISLVLSGLSAFPLEWELALLNQLSHSYLSDSNILRRWIIIVYESIHFVNSKYPFMSYGTDWLAFAHLVIAVFFIGVYKDPVRNQWIIFSGIIACIAVVPLAFIAGSIREIPFFWRLVDCSFGVVGIIPLLYIHDLTERLRKGSDYYMKASI